MNAQALIPLYSHRGVHSGAQRPSQVAVVPPCGLNGWAHLEISTKGYCGLVLRLSGCNTRCYRTGGVHQVSIESSQTSEARS
jgi:hypothetical protein